MKHLVLACCLISAPAFAAIDCPATDLGHPLARADGASLYVGDPASNVLLAPTRQARTMAESNVWLLDGSQPVTLVCQYQGSKARVSAVGAGGHQEVRPEPVGQHVRLQLDEQLSSFSDPL